MSRRSSFVVLASCVALVAGAAVVVTQPAVAKTAVVAKSAAVMKRPCAVGAGVAATQVIVVRSTGSRATVKACRRISNGTYVIGLGPYAAHVGRGGVATAGAKREGDDKTPSGVYRLRGGFGVYKNPGVRFSWLRTDSRDRWVDDSSSPYYNLHMRMPVDGRWKSAEVLRISPSYKYAQVVGFNEKRTPGRGSAIFLHVSNGKATAGCISLAQSSLLKILRWEQPGARISIKRAS